MRLPSRGDVGLDLAGFDLLDIVLAEITIIQRGRCRLAHHRRDRIQSRDGLLLVVGLVRDPAPENEQTAVIDGHLSIVMLAEALVGAVLHDARVRIGEVVLILIARALHRRLGRTALGLFASGLGLALPYFLIIFGFFRLITGLRPLLKHHLGLGQLTLPSAKTDNLSCNADRKIVSIEQKKAILTK